MAWGYYLNMEELSAEIVEEALLKMSNSNYQEIDNGIKQIMATNSLQT